jgi:hypothetical protein
LTFDDIPVGPVDRGQPERKASCHSQGGPKDFAGKNGFASGFTTTASSETEGGVDMNMNSDDLGVPGLPVFMHLNKTTATGGDPKNFEAGTNFQSIVLFGKGDLQQMRQDISELQTN